MATIQLVQLFFFPHYLLVQSLKPLRSHPFRQIASHFAALKGGKTKNSLDKLVIKFKSQKLITLVSDTICPVRGFRGEAVK